MWSLESITSVSSVTCQPRTNGILYMAEVVSLIVPWILPFVMYEFVDGIFVLLSVRSAFFCSFFCSFISMYTNVAWYLGENDAIIFGKSVHFVKEFCDERSGCIFVL